MTDRNTSQRTRTIARFFKSHWKQTTLWLTGPTAVIVFVNEASNFTQLFTKSDDPPKVTVVVQHSDAAAVAEHDKGKPLSIEAARFDEQTPDKIDVICRNPASAPAFVRSAIVELVRVWKLQPIVNNRGKLESSAQYTLTLPAENGPKTIEKELSQEIPAKGLDRFSITVGPAPSKEASAKVYWFRLRLASGDTTLTVGDFLYMTPPSANAPPPTYAANRKLLAEIGQTAGVKNSVLARFLASAPAE